MTVAVSIGSSVGITIAISTVLAAETIHALVLPAVAINGRTASAAPIVASFEISSPPAAAGCSIATIIPHRFSCGTVRELCCMEAPAHRLVSRTFHIPRQRLSHAADALQLVAHSPDAVLQMSCSTVPCVVAPCLCRR